MARFEVPQDVNSYPDGPKPFIAGKYEGEIVGIEEGTGSTSGRPYFQVNMVISAAPEDGIEGRNINQRLYAPQASDEEGTQEMFGQKIKNFTEASGIAVDGNAFDPEDSIGITIGFVLGKQRNNDYMEVKRWNRA